MSKSDLFMVFWLSQTTACNQWNSWFFCNLSKYNSSWKISKALLKSMEKNKADFSLGQIVSSQTGRMAGILAKCMAVQILFNVTTGESRNQTMFLVALSCSAHSWGRQLVNSCCGIYKCGLKSPLVILKVQNWIEYFTFHYPPYTNLSTNIFFMLIW